MGKVVVVTDSTCDLSEKLIKENDIKVIPLYVSFDTEIYKDGIEITSEKLYEMVKEKKQLPKTSACSVGDFMKLFKEYLDQGYEVIYTGIGANLSSTYANALLAQEELGSDKLYVIDSANLSTGIGLLVLKAAKFAKEGKSGAEIKSLIEEMVPKVRSKFVVDSLEYLHKGGRCSGVARFFGTMARLKPVIAVDNGKLNVMAKPIGKRKGLRIMVDDIVSNKDNIHNDCVMLTHAYADEDAEYLKAALKEEVSEAHVEETAAGCVISSHCGKGTIGILYILK